MIPKREGDQGGMDWDFGVSRRKLLYRQWINSKIIVYSIGSYIQYPVINQNGKGYEEECTVSIYLSEPLCCQQKLARLYKSTIFQ